ncbi:alpha/beta fold hydrolase [Streptomyces canarius]
MTATPEITHHTKVLNGINQHWVSAGQGPPVYLLHGFPETWYGWRKQIPVLAEKYTVIAPDLRGYGDTEKPASGYDKRTMARDVLALMDHLGHEKIALVGHDRGARVGTRFAKDHRERIDRFVAMDNIPTRVIADTYDVAMARQGYWFFTFLQVPDLPEALIAGKEETWLTHFYRGWSYDPEMLDARGDRRLRPRLPAARCGPRVVHGLPRGPRGRRPGPRGRGPAHRLPGSDHLGRGLQRRRPGLRRAGRLEGHGP